jgi:polysaccharide export outer membrane protein
VNCVKTFAAACLILLAGCAGGPPLTPGPHLTVTQPGTLPPPSAQDLVATSRPYLIGPFDELAVSVFGLPELTQRIQVDASGTVSLPLAGTIEAGGKTAQQLAREIETRLRGRYVRDPQVTVNVAETVGRVVTVDGEVRTPGLYPVVGRMTLIRTIATAQGTTEFARLQHVVVFRTVNGQNMAALYNLDAIRRGYYEDPEIFANDVVVVGNNPARRIFRDVLTAAPLLTTPIIALLQNNN